MAATCGVSQSRPAGPVPTTTTSPGRLPHAGSGGSVSAAAAAAREQRDREVGHRGGIDVVEPGGALPVHRRALDVEAVAAGVGHGTADGVEGPAELHDGRGVGVGQPAGQLGARQGAGQHGEHLVALHQRLPEGGRRRADRGDPRDDLGRVAVGQPLVHVHVGAVEERVALGEHDDVAAGVEVGGQALRGGGVELVDRALVAAGMIGGLGGDRVDQRLLDLIAAQVRVGDAPGDRAAVPRRVVGDHVCGADEAGGLDRDELGVAGADADAVQGARHCTSSLTLVGAVPARTVVIGDLASSVTGSPAQTRAR